MAKPHDVLAEARNIQIEKNQDYQNDVSTVELADYFPRGVVSLADVLHVKTLRIRAVIDVAQATGEDPKFESLRDSLLDLINYASFTVAYLDGDLPGQVEGRDIFNCKPNHLQLEDKSDQLRGMEVTGSIVDDKDYSQSELAASLRKTRDASIRRETARKQLSQQVVKRND